MHIKEENFKNKVILLNGYAATGKTILPPILDGFKNIMLPTFSYELEWFSNLYLLNEISNKTFIRMIKKITDYRLYNGFIGRELNTRRGDLSSIWRSSKLISLIKKLINLNDKKLYIDGSKSNQILVITITQSLENFESFNKALSNRLLFIEFLRDPFYMFLQSKVLHENVIIGDRRKDFTLRYFDKDTNNLVPPYFKELDFTKISYKSLNDYLIAFLEHILLSWKNIINDHKESNNLLIIPFEQFVLNPTDYLLKMSSFIGEDFEKSNLIAKRIKQQKIPRKTITAYKSNKIYQRYGFKKIDSTNIFEERVKYKRYLSESQNIPKNIIEKLDNLSFKYYEYLLDINLIDKKNTPLQKII